MPKALEGRDKVATVGRYARASWKRKVKTVDANFRHRISLGRRERAALMKQFDESACKEFDVF